MRRALNSIRQMLFFGALLATLFSSTASAKLKSYDLDALAPDQAFAGFSEVNEKADELLAEATKVAQSRGTSVKDEVVKVLNRELQQGVVSYISPDGLVRITDGHHKVIAARKLLAEFKIPDSQVKFSADIAGDFSDSTWKKYVKAREKENPTYFPEAFKKNEKSFDEIEAYYEALPSKFSEIKDLPMRSATGKLFDNLGIKGSSFQPYIQFRLGEELDDLGIEVKSGQEFSFETQKKIRDAVFKGRASERLLSLLKDAAVNSKESEVGDALEKMQALIKQQAPAALASHTVESLYGALPQGTNLADLGLPLPTTTKEFSGLLESAQNRYADRVDPSQIKSLLKSIRDGEELTGKQVKYLKEARKSALNLRSAIKFLGNSDAKDQFKDFRGFVTQLGNLNDKLADWDFEGKMPKAVRQSAEDTLALLDKKVAKLDIPSKTPQDFEAMNAENIRWLREKMASKEVTIGEYHDMRKMVRDYQGVLELMNDDNPSPVTTAALNHLTALQKQMGKLKDGLEIPTEDTAAAEFISRPTQIDASSRQGIETFLAMAEKRDAPKSGAPALSCPTLFKGIKR